MSNILELHLSYFNYLNNPMMWIIYLCMKNILTIRPIWLIYQLILSVPLPQSNYNKRKSDSNCLTICEF